MRFKRSVSEMVKAALLGAAFSLYLLSSLPWILGGLVTALRLLFPRKT